jgi:CRISPR-associated protein Cmr5
MSFARVDQTMAAKSAQILPPVVDRELRTRYRQLPVMLRTAGLAATYAFVASKSRDRTALGQAYARVAGGIAAHLADRRLITAEPNAIDHRQVLELLAGMDLATYAQASAEIAELAEWLSRLADALYRDPDDGAAAGNSE